MKLFGMTSRRLLTYLAVLAVLVAANLWRWGYSADEPPAPPISAGGNMPDLPDLATSVDFDGFSRPVARNLFRPAEEEPAPPPPEPVRVETPPPDPEAAARRAAESLLDNVRVIGFLSTSEGVLAVLGFEGSVINALEGDAPIPGFRVSQVTIDSVTLTHNELAVQRTFTFDGAN